MEVYCIEWCALLEKIRQTLWCCLWTFMVKISFVEVNFDKGIVLSNWGYVMNKNKVSSKIDTYIYHQKAFLFCLDGKGKGVLGIE